MYSIIYADPPWRFSNKNTGGSMVSGAAYHYSTLTVEELCALPIRELANDDCVLLMWWVASQPLEALRVMESWGFTLKTMTGFTWVKLTKNEKPHFGMGFYTRAGSENCLIAVKGKPKRVNASVRSVEIAKVGSHSEKPPVIRDRIVTLLGDLPRVELFAREHPTGWDVFGDEVEGGIVLPKKIAI